MSATVPTFDNSTQAIVWMLDKLEREGEECIDNERFAFADDPGEMALYDKQASEGCCGAADFEVIVNGRSAMVGCNYGH